MTWIAVGTSFVAIISIAFLINESIVNRRLRKDLTWAKEQVIHWRDVHDKGTDHEIIARIDWFRSDMLHKTSQALNGVFKAELLRIEQEVSGEKKALELDRMLEAAKAAVSKE